MGEWVGVFFLRYALSIEAVVCVSNQSRKCVCVRVCVCVRNTVQQEAWKLRECTRSR